MPKDNADPQLDQLSTYVTEHPRVAIGLTVHTRTGQVFHGILVSPQGYLLRLQDEALGYLSDVAPLIEQWASKANIERRVGYLHLVWVRQELPVTEQPNVFSDLRIPVAEVAAWRFNTRADAHFRKDYEAIAQDLPAENPRPAARGY